MNCPECGRLMEFRLDSGGSYLVCPYCFHNIRLPDPPSHDYIENDFKKGWTFKGPGPRVTWQI